MITDLLIVLGAYLAGSISSAIITCRLLGLPDPRSQGSGNPGATNVLRVGGKKAAAITLIGDSLKGLIPVLIAHGLDRSDAILAATAFAAFIGHLYPVFFGFRGGKGVATALGVQFGLYWPIGMAIAVVWLVVAKIMNLSSLAALVSQALAPLIIWLLWPSPPLLVMQICLSSLLIWRHRSNIQNLLAGTEGRISRPDDGEGK